MKNFTYIALIILLTTSCTKDIAILLPYTEPEIVVEGKIESGSFPYVILTYSSGYFDSTDISNFEASFVRGADLKITVDGTDYPMTEICSDDIPEAFLAIIAEQLSLNLENLSQFNYCIYANIDLIGIEGKTYQLTINHNNETYTATTTIPDAVPLDSVWFKIEEDDKFGYAWARLSDPDTVGNFYRWFAQRINVNDKGIIKDAGYIAPLGSAIEDRFFNGESFDFLYYRSQTSISNNSPSDIYGYFTLNDTVAIKFATMDAEVYDFLRKFETEVGNNGNPFAAPTTIPTNISNGALGCWAGYAVTFDTLVCIP